MQQHNRDSKTTSDKEKYYKINIYVWKSTSSYSRTITPRPSPPPPTNTPCSLHDMSSLISIAVSVKVQNILITLHRIVQPLPIPYIMHNNRGPSTEPCGAPLYQHLVILLHLLCAYIDIILKGISSLTWKEVKVYRSKELQREREIK